MKYTKFIIKNFKGIDSLEIDINKSPNGNIFSLIGLNESGKTTILEAINFLSEWYDDSRYVDLVPKSKRLNFSDKIAISSYISLDTEDKKHIKDFLSKNSFILENISDEIILSKEIQFQDTKPGEIWNCRTIKLEWKTPKWKKNRKLININKPLWHKTINYIEENFLWKIIYYPNFLFTLPSKIYLEELEWKQWSTAEQSLYRGVLQDILDSLNNDLVLGRHILDRLKSKDEWDKENLTRTLLRMWKTVSRKISDRWSEIYWSTINIEVVFSSGENDHWSYIEINIQSGSSNYKISERSLWFRWFFFFILFTEFRAKRFTEKWEQLFLLDEPAYNLHQTAQKKLLSIFEELSQECKIIYTTHSHHLINPKHLSGSYIIKNEALEYDNELDFVDKDTEISCTPYRQFVSQYPNKKMYFQPALDALDYQPSQLETTDKITIIEWKYDYYTLRYINEIILENKYNVNLYPGDWAWWNTEAIRMYYARWYEFKVLLDSDSAGKRAIKKYYKEFGKIIESNIIDFESIDGSRAEMEMEDFFEDKEKLDIQKTLYPSDKTYNKKHLNNAIEQLFIDWTSFELSANTKDKFKKTLDTIKS